MRNSVATVLLNLNREFYQAVAAPFNMTRMARSSGKERLLTFTPMVGEGRSVRVADIGCGNGRLGWMLDTLARPVDYVGVDADAQLLTAAAKNTAALDHVRSVFLCTDLAESGWNQPVRAKSDAHEGFDLVTCLATLQHMPGFDLRVRIMRELAALLADDGRLIVSAWQFMQSERLRSRLLNWEEIDINPTDIEPGDALLPWKQDVYAIRYVHQIDSSEMKALADAAQLEIVDSYRADGREGNLNLYCVLRAV